MKKNLIFGKTGIQSNTDTIMPNDLSDLYIIIAYPDDKFMVRRWMQKYGFADSDISILYHSLIVDKIYFHNKAAYLLWVLNPPIPEFKYDFY